MFRRIVLWRKLAILTAGLAGAAACLAVTFPVAAVEPADGAPGSEWIRVQRDDRDRPVAMQTAVVRYVPRDANQPSVSVDLIGAVHVADRAYYDQLNQDFEQYDALLYELVAPQGTIITKEDVESNGHPVRSMQNGMKLLFELDHQLEGIDYTKENFVHADMSPTEFAQAMEDRDESIMQLFFRMMGRGIAQQSKLQAEGRSTDFDMLSAFFSQNRALSLKRAMADQFENMDSMIVGLGGPNGTTLIAGRNQVALDVLQGQLEDGKEKIGIFYGAGHLVDMDKRLRERFDLKPVSVRWLTAWDLSEQD